MLSYTDLTPGTMFILDGDPYEVLDYKFVRMQQRKPVVQTKIKNLSSGKILSRTFQPSDTFKEAEIMREELKFVYSHRGEYVFQHPDNPKDRFPLSENLLGEYAKFLKPSLVVTAYKFGEQIINIKLPIKIDYEVKEAPPSVKGDTAQGGTKTVALEGGFEINVPLFINVGDIVRVNTESGLYTERVTKGN
jgi:elongation factor P